MCLCVETEILICQVCSFDLFFEHLLRGVLNGLRALLLELRVFGGFSMEHWFHGFRFAMVFASRGKTDGQNGA